MKNCRLFLRGLFECPSTMVREKGCFVEHQSNNGRRIVEEDVSKIHFT